MPRGVAVCGEVGEGKIPSLRWRMRIRAHGFTALSVTEVERVGQIQGRRDGEEIRVVSNTHMDTQVYMKWIKMFVYAGGKRKCGKRG